MIKILDLNFQGVPKVLSSFLIKTEEGPILIETGPHSTLDNLKSALQEEDIALEDIKHVFLTHIHFDHAGAAWCLAEAGAKIYVHPRGYKHLVAPERLYNSAKRIYGEEMDTLWGKMKPIPEDQLVAVEHEQFFNIGNTTIKAWHTPGHAVHHIAWQIGTSLIAGDVAGIKIESGPVMPPCPPPDINLEDWQGSIRLLRALNISKIYLSHFGCITNLHPHLDELEERLFAWADWMKPHYKKGTSPEEIVPLFQKMVAAELKGSNVNELGIKQYDGANPAFMAVAGLLRYWHKKLNP